MRNPQRKGESEEIYFSGNKGPPTPTLTRPCSSLKRSGRLYPHAEGCTRDKSRSERHAWARARDQTWSRTQVPPEAIFHVQALYCTDCHHNSRHRATVARWIVPGFECSRARGCYLGTGRRSRWFAILERR